MRPEDTKPVAPDPVTHTTAQVAEMERKYEATIEDLLKQRDAARDIANANYEACNRLREALDVIMELSATSARTARDSGGAAFRAVAHICDNTRATAKYCDIGEIPF